MVKSIFSFFKWAIAGRTLFNLFSYIQAIYTIFFDLSRIWTRIIRVEGEHADHLNTTKANTNNSLPDDSVGIRAEFWKVQLHTLYKKSPKIVYQITEAVFCGRLSCAVLSPEILFPLNVPKSSNIECSAKHTFASFECCCIKRSVCTSLSLSTCMLGIFHNKKVKI